MGAAFRERLVPHGVLWFTGEAMEEQIGEEEEGEEEEEEEEYEQPQRRGKGGKQRGGGGGGRGAPQEGDQECKQQ